MRRDCEQARRELAAGNREGAAGHLGDCAACRREDEWIRALTEELSRSRELTPPPALDARVRQALSSTVGRARHLRSWVALTTLSAAAAVSLGGSLWLALAGSAAGERAAWLTAVAIGLYIVFSSGALSPLLLRWVQQTRLEVVR